MMIWKNVQHFKTQKTDMHIFANPYRIRRAFKRNMSIYNYFQILLQLSFQSLKSDFTNKRTRRMTALCLSITLNRKLFTRLSRNSSGYIHYFYLHVWIILLSQVYLVTIVLCIGFKCFSWILLSTRLTGDTFTWFQCVNYYGWKVLCAVCIS